MRCIYLMTLEVLSLENFSDDKYVSLYAFFIYFLFTFYESIVEFITNKLLKQKNFVSIRV